MPRQPSNVSGFRKPEDLEELARLKRLTGLEFETVPESLLVPTLQESPDPEAPRANTGTDPVRP